MFKRFLGIFVSVLLIMATFAGCGSSSKNSAAANYAAAPSEAYNELDTAFGEPMYEQEADYGSGEMAVTSKADEASAEEKPKSEEGPLSLSGTGSTLENVSNAILNERKIIRSANLSIEVDNFDEARNQINTIINGIGIVQESNVTTNDIYVDGKIKLLKHGTIVLRVYKEKFDSVFNNLKGIGSVRNETISGQDVTDRFVDTESRLRLLKLEQSRLEAYLQKLEDLDKIFRTESRLTEIRQEIESLTGNLNKMSSLVELSTITITIDEKNPNVVKDPNPETYWGKLLDSLKSSFEGVVIFIGDLLIFVIAAIPVLIMIGLFVLLGVFIYRRIPKKRRITVAEVKKENPEEKKE